VQPWVDEIIEARAKETQEGRAEKQTDFGTRATAGGRGNQEKEEAR